MRGLKENQTNLSKVKSPLLFRHHNTEVCPTAEINSSTPDSTFPGKHLESCFVLIELPPTPNLHCAIFYWKPMCTNLIKAPSYQLLIWDYHIWFSVHCPCSHASISKTRQQPAPAPRCIAHRDVSCGSSPQEVFSCRMHPWDTMEHTASFIHGREPASAHRTCQVTPARLCTWNTILSKDLGTRLQRTLLCGWNETLQLLPWIWKTGNMVTPKFLQQLPPHPALTTLHLIAKWQRIFPFPSIKSCAVTKGNGTKS